MHKNPSFVEGARTTSRLNWAAHDEAKKFNFAAKSDEWLGKRMNDLLDLQPPCPDELDPARTGVHVRIDPGYQEWQRLHAAEAYAIHLEFKRRWNRMKS